MKNKQSYVRLATTADLDFIKEWLQKEERNGRGFIHNFGLIKEAAAESQMYVFDRGQGAVAFLTFGISRSSIIQVRNDQLRHGIGRALVETAILEEEAKNNAVLVVQCEPKSSIEFWSRMGFVAHQDSENLNAGNRSIYMHRLSKMTHTHVSGDDLELVEIRTYHERFLYGKGEDISPHRVFYVMAKIDPDKYELQLARRISIPDEGALRDVAVEIIWGGQIFCGKAKHSQAEEIGFVRTPNLSGWYIDKIKLPTYEN